MQKDYVMIMYFCCHRDEDLKTYHTKVDESEKGSAYWFCVCRLDRH